MSAKSTIGKDAKRKVAPKSRAILKPESIQDSLESKDDAIELVFGLVAPTGVDFSKVSDSLQTQLRGVGYKTVLIRLSELISAGAKLADSFPNEYERIKTLMDTGTKLREATGQADIVARLGIAKIREEREDATGSFLIPAGSTAYIVTSFKRREEVELFRQVYGKAFSLISVYSPRQCRIEDLTKRLRSSLGSKALAAERAVQLVERDFEEEGRKSGQRVGKTFPLADFFLTLEPRAGLDKQTSRLVQLTFGHPYISPSKDEQAMFYAQAAALRSLDLSRQVGAAIVDKEGAILATGCNDVPKHGGGLYWADDVNASRDFELGYDANARIKAEITEDMFSRLRVAGWLSSLAMQSQDKQLADESLHSKNAFLGDSQMYDVIEFGRAVHAEASAITEAARRGVRTEGTRLFCTTFPCHICARHIVSSGIEDVVFIEPYEKSRTAELYADSVAVEPQSLSSAKVNFRAFVGVAPRRYMDAFQAIEQRKTPTGKILEADQIAGKPRVSRVVLTYLLVEEMVIRDAAKLPSAT